MIVDYYYDEENKEVKKCFFDNGKLSSKKLRNEVSKIKVDRDKLKLELRILKLNRFFNKTSFTWFTSTIDKYDS